MNDSLRFTAPQLAGGMSKQPPHLRLPGQVEDAQSVYLSVVDGISKRPGTVLDRVISGLDPGGEYRLVMMKRDQDEEYAIVYGRVGSNFTIKAFRVGGGAATVNVSAAAQKYLNLNQATSEQVRLRTIGDTLYLINTTVMVGTLPAATYSLTATWATYDQMVAHTPADATYHKANAASGENPAGYFKYDVGGITFAVRSFPTISGPDFAAPYGKYDNASYMPGGFKIGFQRQSLSGTHTFDNATRKVTLAGAYALYDFYPADYVFMANSGVFAGKSDWWKVEAKNSDGEIVLANTTSLEHGYALPAAAGNATPTGVGELVEVTYSADTLALDDMHAVAAKFQTQLRLGQAGEALCEWVDVGYQKGYFKITSPFRGAGATFFGPYAPTSGQDLHATGLPFDGALSGTGSVTTGTGGTSTTVSTLALASRWTQTVASGQADAQIDANTMPVLMKRTQVGTTSVFSIEAPTFDQRSSGDPTTNPTPSLWRKDGATQGTGTYSAANPTVVTSTAHGLTSGDAVSNSGSTGTVSIDGNRIVTVTDADHFTVPVDATAGGGSVTWRKGGNTISDATMKDARLMLAGGNSAVFSRVRDTNNFYIADATNLVDSDPIDVPIGSQDVAIIDFVVPIHKTIAAFTKAGKQWELNTADALTPSTAGWTTTTSHATRSVRPQLMGSRLYFVGEAVDYSTLFEYVFNELTLPSSAFEVSTHILDTLPSEIRSIDTNANNSMVLVLPEDDGLTARLFVYKAFWNGDEKIQSAWARWNFDPGYRILDVAVLGDEAWMLVESCAVFTSDPVTTSTKIHSPSHGLADGDPIMIPVASPSVMEGAWNILLVDPDYFKIMVDTRSYGSGYGKWGLGEFTLERLPLSRPAARPGWAYATYLDRQVKLTGSFAASTTTWTLTAPYGGSLRAKGSTLNRIVLGPSFGANSGDVHAIETYGSTNTVSISGDYSAGEAVLGAYFTASVELTRPFVRDRQGNIDFFGTVTTTDLMTVNYRSGDYTVTVTPSDGSQVSTSTFTPAGVLSVLKEQIFKSSASGVVEGFSTVISSSGPKPMTISAYQWIGTQSEPLR